MATCPVSSPAGQFPYYPPHLNWHYYPSDSYYKNWFSNYKDHWRQHYWQRLRGSSSLLGRRCEWWLETCCKNLSISVPGSPRPGGGGAGGCGGGASHNISLTSGGATSQHSRQPTLSGPAATDYHNRHYPYFLWHVNIELWPSIFSNNQSAAGGMLVLQQHQVLLTASYHSVIQQSRVSPYQMSEISILLLLKPY